MLCEQSIVRNNSGLKFQTAVFGWNELLAYHGMDGETSERETIMKNFRKYVLSILLCFTLTGCGQQAGFSESVSAVPENNFTESQTGVPETVMQQTDADAETAEIKSASDNVRPSKEEVLAMREKTLDGIENLLLTQQKILQNGAKYLAPNGRLVYSTCTVNHHENEAQVRQFLQDNQDFSVIAPQITLSGMRVGEYGTLFLPHETSTDGFFAAILERQKNC